MAKEIKIGNWYVGWHTWKPEITYSECGYEDGRGNLIISLFGWLSRFYFPWKSKRFPNGDCDAPQWGIAVHGRTLWIYKGGNGNLGGGSKWWTWELPFVNYGTSIRWDVYVGDKDKPQSKWTKDDWKAYPRDYTEKLGTEWRYKIIDPYDGEIIPCSVIVKEMEWRPKWLKWTSLFAKVKRTIEVEFAREVGRRKGSWKGGVLGCSYIIKPNETIKECLDRIMIEKEFF